MRFKWIGITFLCVLVCSVAVFRRVRASSGPTVTVSVQATDPGGFPLHYAWKSTDGSITNVDAATTTWTLPNGYGIHFAYVLVSDQHGGYTERRVAVNTDTIGTPPVIPPPVTWSAPASSMLVGDYYRSWAINGGSYNNAGVFTLAYVPNARVYVVDTITHARYPATGTILTDVKGQYVIPNLPAGDTFQANCSFDGGTTFENCTQGVDYFNNPNFFPMPSNPATAWTDYYVFEPTTTAPTPFTGNLTLADGNPCGTSNEFFNVHSTGTATLESASLGVLATETLPENGVWSLPYSSAAAWEVLKCENAGTITLPVSGFTSGVDYGQQTIASTGDPIVSTMTAKLNGSTVGTLAAPLSLPPSDLAPAADAFLEEKGLDTQVSACKYYLAIGAVKTCDSSGNFTGAINFEDWKREVKIDNYASTTEYAATFINEADLNLTRNHHSVSYGPNETAGYVCNSEGYVFTSSNEFLKPTQTEVNTAVTNATTGHGAVAACVAMDWGITVGVNGNQSFTRFLIFGPSGQLLPSVNLDTRREKYVPGTCIVCHGGDHYAGHFPTDGTGKANIGAHFLPYDEGNFLFSSAVGLRQVDQEASIYHLNQNVLNAGPPVQEGELIRGWYANGQTQNLNFLPASYVAENYPPATSFYENVQARSCRGCHITQIEAYDWEHTSNMVEGHYFDPFTVCAPGAEGWRTHSMPNSLITLDRFWLSSKNTVGLPDQPAIFTQDPGLPGPPGTTCNVQ